MKDNIQYTQYFSREQVEKQIKIPGRTIERWSAAFHDTDLVHRAGGRMYYSSLFVLFIRGRVHSTGPSGLPDVPRIVALLDMYNRDLTSIEMAEELDENFIVIEAQLMALNLEEKESENVGK